MKKGDKLTQLAKLLEEKGVSQKELERLLTTKEQQKLSTKVNQPRTKLVYTFGIVSDTHLVDKGCALAELHDFYKKCKAAGVTEIVHGGDLLTGQNVYPGQSNDLLCFGVDAHVDYAAENYPKLDGIKTIVCGGITKDDYDKKLQELKDKQHKLDLEAEEHTKADHDYKIVISQVFSLSRRVGALFKSSEVSEKRAILNFLLQNPTVSGKKLEFTMAKPFDSVLELAYCPTDLPLVDKFRIADWSDFEQKLRFSGLLGFPAFRSVTIV